MKNSVGDCLYIGKDTTIKVAPKETIRFYINDVPGNYGDNKGFVKVKWSIESQSLTRQIDLY
jgi:ribosomal protein S17E